jgi:hypothetical protein
MAKNINKLIIISVTAAILLSACTATTPTKPLIKEPIVSSIPTIVDIIGIREWKPLQESSLLCASKDNGGGTLQYIWLAESGTIKGEGQKVTWIAPASTGEYKIHVEAANSKGEKASFSKTFKVTDNPYNNDTPDSTIYLKLSLPSANSVTEKRHPRIWTTSDIQCVVSASDNSDLTYQWTAPTGKLEGDNIKDGKASRIGWIAPGVAGIYTVSVIVTDKSGNTASGEVSFDVYCCKP